jgi:hypothetical protein
LVTGERTALREDAVRDTAIQKTTFFTKQVEDSALLAAIVKATRMGV